MDDAATGRSVRDLLIGLEPLDAIEEDHRDRALAWVSSSDDLYRRTQHPVAPRRHLVSYFLLVDDEHRLLLLGDHLKAGLWLPSGGHVEVGEHPVDTVRRECREELQTEARFHPGLQASPLFVTITQTSGPDPHEDVSLWFVLQGGRDDALTPDPKEYRSIRWWSIDDVRGHQTDSFDPHMGRMIDKLIAAVWSP